MYQLQYFITTLNLSLKQNKSFFIVTKTKFILQLIKLLIKNKYFIGYKLHKHKKLIVFFKLNLSCGQPLMRTCNLISTLGCRIFVKYNQWPNNSSSIFILSTVRGLLTNIEARRLKIGGFLLFRIV